MITGSLGFRLGFRAGFRGCLLNPYIQRADQGDPPWCRPLHQLRAHPRLPYSFLPIHTTKHKHTTLLIICLAGSIIRCKKHKSNGPAKAKGRLLLCLYSPDLFVLTGAGAAEMWKKSLSKSCSGATLPRQLLHPVTSHPSSIHICLSPTKAAGPSPSYRLATGSSELQEQHTFGK